VNSEAVALSAATAPLTQLFGDRLTLWREDNRVQWSCDGQAVLVELNADGELDATFVDAPTTDAVSGEPAVAVYRRRSGIAYRMTADGASRMVADMTEFFSGVREPRFTFVAAEAV
jgi:hypothetical protein